MLDSPALLLFAPIAALGVLLAVRYWQHALFGVFVLLVFEGALRKWAFPSAQAQIYLVKDAILLAAYLGFVLDGRRNQPVLRGMASIKIVLLVVFAFGCFEVFNPNSPSILVGLTGLKSYFLYVPIAFILPYAFKSREHLLHMIRLYLLMAIPVALLGFIQVAAGPDSFLNTYVSHTEDAAVLAHFGSENIVRTSGTFSYISGYTAFLSFVAFLAIGYNLANGWRIRNNIVPILALTLVVGAMFTTGSRAPVYTLVATGPVILWLAASGRVLPIRTAVRLCLLIPIVVFVALHLSPRAFEAFTQRATESSDSTVERLLYPINQTIEALSGAPAVGMGIGATHPSAFTIMGTQDPWWLGDLLVEDEMARVTVELGFIGFLLIYLLRFVIVGFALHCALSFKEPAYRALGIVLMIHLAVASVFGSITLNVTSGLYYWGAVGILLAMRRFEQSPRTQVRAMLVRGPTSSTQYRAAREPRLDPSRARL
jgi:hypothetical protein